MLGTLCLSTKEPITTKHRFSGSICAGFGVPLLQDPYPLRAVSSNTVPLLLRGCVWGFGPPRYMAVGPDPGEPGGYEVACPGKGARSEHLWNIGNWPGFG